MTPKTPKVASFCEDPKRKLGSLDSLPWGSFTDSRFALARKSSAAMTSMGGTPGNRDGKDGRRRQLRGNKPKVLLGEKQSNPC